METKNSKLLQALERSGADKISEAYHWVHDNKHMFRREVYGPILLEVCFVAWYQLLFSLLPRCLSLYFFD
jgi:hypothetical protein